MSPASNTLLALILLAIGFLGIILSFLVPDKRKSNISMALAGLIIVFGLFQWVSQVVVRMQINSRMRQLQRQSQVDLDALRQKIKDQAKTAPTAAPKKS